MTVEQKISELELKLRKAKEELGDLTQEEAWNLVNRAAHSIENVAINYFYNSKSRAKAVVQIASKMRDDLEDAIGPQPGYGPRRTVPKRKS